MRSFHMSVMGLKLVPVAVRESQNKRFKVPTYGGDESNVPKTYVTYRQDLQDRSRPSRTGQGPPGASPGHPGAAPGPVLRWF